MLDEPLRDDADSWQCAHCAARFAAPLLFCPSCGANQRITPSQRVAPSAPSRTAADGGAEPYDPYVPRRRFLDRWRAFLGATGLGVGGGYSFDYGPIDEEGGAPRSRWRRRLAWSALAASAFVFIAYAILPDNSVIGSMSGVPGVPAIEGAVHGAMDPLSDEDTVTSLANQMPGVRDGAADKLEQDLAADDGNVSAAQAGPSAAAPNGGASTRVDADVGRQLAIVRADLGRKSLWPARRAMRTALALQPHNDDVQRLSSELASHERERDALLGHARLCARNGQWGCVRDYAGRAANVDTSSREARRLLARASGNHEVVVARRSTASPDLFGRLKHWLQRNRSRPARPLVSWNGP